MLLTIPHVRGTLFLLLISLLVSGCDAPSDAQVNSALAASTSAKSAKVPPPKQAHDMINGETPELAVSKLLDEVKLRIELQKLDPQIKVTITEPTEDGIATPRDAIVASWSPEVAKSINWEAISHSQLLDLADIEFPNDSGRSAARYYCEDLKMKLYSKMFCRKSRVTPTKLSLRR